MGARLDCRFGSHPRDTWSDLADGPVPRGRALGLTYLCGGGRASANFVLRVHPSQIQKFEDHTTIGAIFNVEVTTGNGLFASA